MFSGKTKIGQTVALLTWEIEPMVAGGSWTACYHFVRQLIKRQTKLTVIAPWHQDCIAPEPFDCKVPLALLGIIGNKPALKPNHSSNHGPNPLKTNENTRRDAYRPYASSGYGPDPYQPFPGDNGNSSYCPIGPDPYSASFFSFMRQASGRYTERLLELQRRTPFALIHAQDWITFEAAGAVAGRYGIPWLAHFHSLESDRRPWAPDPAIVQIERKAAQTADYIVTPSRVTARAVAQQYSVSLHKIVVVPNVLSSSPTPFRQGRFDSKKVIFLGRLELQKAPDRFAQVAALVQRHDQTVAFHIYGAGQLRSELNRPDARIDLHGPLSWKQRWSAFAGASALLLPSRAEPFGMVVLEAMQCGVPVIYSDQAGVAEVVQSGIPIPADDIKGTARCLQELLSDPLLWEGLASAAERESNNYPDRGYEQQLLAVYKELGYGP